MHHHQEAEREARASLEQLTGFPHAVFFQTGTAALEAIVQVFSSEGDSVGVPALGCWTLSFAVTKHQRRCEFLDVDEYWSARLDQRGPAVSILIDPWAAAADWTQGGERQTRIADMTLAPGARFRGRTPAESCVAGVLSLGAGKPLSLGGGGVALFRDPEHAQEAKRLFRFGFEDGRWKRRLERYTFSPHLFPPLSDRLRQLPALDAVAENAERAREVLMGSGLQSNALRPDASWGHDSCLPVCLPPDFPLSPRDVEGVAICAGLRLARHPVSPPYEHDAWPTKPSSACPRAEDLARRSLFFYAVDYTVDHLPPFFEALLASPEQFRTPFPLPRPRGELPTDVEKLARGCRLVRDLEGNYGLMNELDNLMWPLEEKEAALIQARNLALEDATDPPG